MGVGVGVGVVGVGVGRVVIMEHAVEEPGADAVHDQGRDRDDQHDAGARLAAAVELGDGFAHDLDRRAEDEHRVEDAGHGLRAAHAEREARGGAADGDAHRDEAHGEGEHVHEQVQGVGLEDDAPGDEGAHELEAEEEGDDREDDREASRLTRLAGGEASGGRGGAHRARGVVVGRPAVVMVVQRGVTVRVVVVVVVVAAAMRGARPVPVAVGRGRHRGRAVYTRT